MIKLVNEGLQEYFDSLRKFIKNHKKDIQDILKKCGYDPASIGDIHVDADNGAVFFDFSTNDNADFGKVKKAFTDYFNKYNGFVISLYNEDPQVSVYIANEADVVEESYKKDLRKESYRYYSDLEGLDDTTLDIIRKLDELDYYGIKPIQFGKDTLMSFSKNYFTDKVKSNGVTVDIDPLNGDVTVTEFIYDIDGEDLTVLCPVKKVRTVKDVIKIDRWANNIRKWWPNVIKLISENRYGYVHDEDEAKLSPPIRSYLKRRGFIPIVVDNKQYYFMDFNYGNLFCDIYVDEWGNCYLVTDNDNIRPTDMFYTITDNSQNDIDDLITLGNTITSTGDVKAALDVFFG